jgi:hypothetical protein
MNSDLILLLTRYLLKLSPRHLVLTIKSRDTVQQEEEGLLFSFSLLIGTILLTLLTQANSLLHDNSVLKFWACF